MWAEERHPEARPRIISDNEPQFIAKDFQGVHSDLGHDARQNFALLSSIERKIERSHKSLKGECIRPGTPLSLEDTRRLVEGYVERYNNARLNNAVGYMTPKDMLAGCRPEIHADRDRKLEGARRQWQIRRQSAA